jgi:hypothetical protein
MNTQQSSRPSQSTSSSGTTASSPGSSQDVRVMAGDAVAKLADVAQQAGSQAKQTAASLASEANQRAKGFLHQGVTSGADLVGHIADSAKSAADNLGDKAPQLAELVRGAAERVEAFSHEMRGKSVDELIRTASDFTRRQPAIVFGLASLAGFFLFRVLKADPETGAGTGGTRDWQGGQNTGQFQGTRDWQGGPRTGQFHGT